MQLPSAAGWQPAALFNSQFAIRTAAKMASLVYREDRNRKGWLLSFYTADRKQRSIWLGECSKRNANNVKRHVEELVRSQKASCRPEADTDLWAESTRGKLRESLIKFGLVRPSDAKPSSEASLYLGPFIDDYIENRSDLKGLTIQGFKQARAWAVAYFGERKLLASITKGDFEKFVRWMQAKPTEAEIKSKTKLKQLSKPSAGKYAKRIRQAFEFAMRSRLMPENPGEGTKLGQETNPSRQSFITRTMAASVLAKCPSTDWKLIFALARFCGLRCPTEVLALTWGDVDWEKGRLRIDSVKTGLRWCPLFPEVRTLLEQALEEAPRKRSDAFVIHSHRGSNANLRTHLTRIIKAAGLEPWPKLFNNLRASCRTELEERFPSHVCDAWLGHSMKVAKAHYLQVTDDHWERGAKEAIGATAGATICALPESPEVSTESEKSSKCQVKVTTDDSSKVNQYPQVESHNQHFPQGIKRIDKTAQLPAQRISPESFVVALADASGNVVEVLADWPSMADAVKHAVGYMTSRGSDHLFPVVLQSLEVRHSQAS